MLVDVSAHNRFGFSTGRKYQMEIHAKRFFLCDGDADETFSTLDQLSGMKKLPRCCQCHIVLCTGEDGEQTWNFSWHVISFLLTCYDQHHNFLSLVLEKAKLPSWIPKWMMDQAHWPQNLMIRARANWYIPDSIVINALLHFHLWYEFLYFKFHRPIAFHWWKGKKFLFIFL